MASERGGWTRTSLSVASNLLAIFSGATNMQPRALTIPSFPGASWRCVCTAARRQRISIFRMAQTTSSARGARHASCLLTRTWSKRPSLLPLTWCVACNVRECS